jgi:hypothetical protein
MKKGFFQIILAMVAALLTTIAFSLGFESIGIEGVLFANLVPVSLSDPDIIRRWSRKYFYRTQAKTVFDERYTGTTMSNDGVKYTDTIVGPPVILVNDLSTADGMTVTYTMIEPLYQNSSDRLSGAEGRVKGQAREGSEKRVNKKFIKFPVASKFWSVREEDVFVGKKEIGMADMLSIMTKQLSDNVAQYMDDDCIDAFYTGYSSHLWTTIAGDGATDGQAVVGSADLGVVTGPAEHLNTYAWIKDGTEFKLIKAATNSTADVATMMNQITSDAVPSAKLLDAISFVCKMNNIVGSEYRGGIYGPGKTFIKVMVDPMTMWRLRQDSVFRETVNSAYQAKGDEHPLIKQGDLLWGNLHVCEFEKLAQDRWSNKYSFNATGAGGTGNAAISVAGTAGTANRTLALTLAARVLGGAAAGDAKIGANGGDKIANIMVLGANSLGRVPGGIYPLIPRSTDDYKRITGIGSEHIFGHKRLDFTNNSNVPNLNQSSLRVAVYRGSASDIATV